MHPSGMSKIAVPSMSILSGGTTSATSSSSIVFDAVLDRSRPSRTFSAADNTEPSSSKPPLRSEACSGSGLAPVDDTPTIESLAVAGVCGA